MFDQKGRAGGTARDQNAFAIECDAKRDHHGAEQKGQDILIQTMGNIVLFWGVGVGGVCDGFGHDLRTVFCLMNGDQGTMFAGAKQAAVDGAAFFAGF